MSFLNLILDLAALMLWLNWRALGFRQAVSYRSSLVHTLKSTAPGRLRRWPSLAGMVALLLLRAPLYGKLGPALHWVPHLDLHVVALPFRSDLPGRMFAFSMLSFLRILVLAYFWLLLPSLLNRRTPAAQAVQQLVRVHLGPVDRWPAPVKCLLPLLLVLVLWLAVHPWLAGLRLVPAQSGFALLFEQGLVLGLTLFLSWKLLLLGLLFLHLLHSYVYLGRSAVWDFVNETASNVLKPLAVLPLRLQRVDFSPALAILALWGVGEVAGRELAELFRRLPL